MYHLNLRVANIACRLKHHMCERGERSVQLHELRDSKILNSETSSQTPCANHLFTHDHMQEYHNYLPFDLLRRRNDDGHHYRRTAGCRAGKDEVHLCLPINNRSDTDHLQAGAY
jgi:hypothetical protein